MDAHDEVELPRNRPAQIAIGEGRRRKADPDDLDGFRKSDVEAAIAESLRTAKQAAPAGALGGETSKVSVRGNRIAIEEESDGEEEFTFCDDDGDEVDEIESDPELDEIEDDEEEVPLADKQPTCWLPIQQWAPGGNPWEGGTGKRLRTDDECMYVPYREPGAEPRLIRILPLGTVFSSTEAQPQEIPLLPQQEEPSGSRDKGKRRAIDPF